jgi:predicted acylesterase/phospholipase RssA
MLIARMFAVGEFVDSAGTLIKFPEDSLESYLHTSLHLLVAILAVPIAIFALFLIDSIRLHEQIPGAGGEHAFALPFNWNALRQRRPWIADRKWFKWIFKFLGAGFFTDDRVRSGHLLATAFVFVLGIVYVAGRYILRPSGNWIHSVPVLYFIVLLASLLLWAGGFLSFWADRYRIPVLLSFLAVISVLNLAFDSDHYFITTNLSGPSVAIPSLTPDQIYKGWLQRHPNGDDPIVVVTAAGGGIQAAGWTTKVLTELEAETDNCRSQFRDSLLLLSGVSGGSVGTMYYADSYIDSTPDDQVKRLAEQSSLREVAWGIAYFDFWRSVRPTGTDRATAMEEAWGRVWHGQNATAWSGASRKLSEWKDAVAEHDQPAVILNSTIVETGERFLITNFSIDPRQTGLHDYGAASWSFAHKFPGCDLNIRTAARLSATFPFVSPVPQARGCEGPQRYHFADGGYYDNFGVSSAIDWLRMAGVNKQALGKHKLLWIQVLSFPPTSQTVPSSVDFKNRFGWALQAAAPVMTMNDVRDAGQRERDGIEISYLRSQLNPDQFEELQFVFHGSNPPLSWHLLPSQKAAIDDSWKSWQLDPSKSTDIDHVKQAFGCSLKGADVEMSPRIRLASGKD